MNQFRVPTVSLPVEITLAGSQRLQGSVFLPELSDSHSGRPHPEEWLNGPSRFVPFRTENGASVILNKDSMVVLSVPLHPEDTPEYPTRSVTVRVWCDGEMLEGQVQIDLPPNQSRVLDFMNQPGSFFSLTDGRWCRLVNRRFVSRIEEINPGSR